MMNKKALIALSFATIMIFSGVGIMGFEALSQWNPGLQGAIATPDEGSYSASFSFTYDYTSFGTESSFTDTAHVSATYLDIGQSLSITNDPETSVSSTTYYYDHSSSSSNSWTPGSTGSFEVGVEISDSDGTYGTENGEIVCVVSDPTVSISASRTSLDTGQSVSFTSSESGGTGTYSYQ